MFTGRLCSGNSVYVYFIVLEKEFSLYTDKDEKFHKSGLLRSTKFNQAINHEFLETGTPSFKP